MDTPILGISSLGDDMRITMDVRSPIASMEFFEALAKLLKNRLVEIRQPSPGDLEIASWTEATPGEGGT